MASKVFYAAFDETAGDDLICEQTRRVFGAASLGDVCGDGQLTAVKTHFGEKGNDTYVAPQFVRVVVDEVKAAGGKPCLVETATLYRGQRHNAVDHFNVAVEHGIELGDTVDLVIGAMERSVTVVGLFVDVEWCPYPNCMPTRAYVGAGVVDALGLPSLAETPRAIIGVRLQDPDDLEQVKEAALAALLEMRAVSIYKDWEDVRDSANNATAIQSIFLTGFSAVAGLAAGFLVANGVSGAVRAQTRSIGLLKAAGLTGRQLALVYLAEYLILALVGSLIGLAIGHLGVSIILRPAVGQFGETSVQLPAWVAPVAALSALVVTTLSTALPIRRAVRLDAVEAIRRGAERPVRAAARLVRVRTELALALSNLLSRPTRTLLTVLALGMAVFTLTFASVVTYSLRYFLENPAELGWGVDGDLTVSRARVVVQNGQQPEDGQPVTPPETISDEEARRLIVDQAGVAAYYAQIWYIFELSEEDVALGPDEALYGMFREGDLGEFLVPVMEGRMFDGPNEAIVGYQMARERGLQPGDAVTVPLGTERVTLQIVGTYREPGLMGRVLMASIETLRQAGTEAEAWWYVVKLDSDAEAEAVRGALELASSGGLDVDVADDEQDLPAAIMSLPWLMAALSLVLGGIAAFGVFGSVWMTVREQRREMAVLKAMGTTPSQLAVSVLAGGVAMALVASVIGLPVGLVGTRALLDFLARWQGFGPLSIPVDVIALLPVVPATAAVGALGSLIPARRAARLSVVEAIRYE